MNRTKILPAIAVLLFAACGANTARESAIVTDSAGVQITQLQQPLMAMRQAWTVSAEPLLDIGTQEGDSAYELHRVVGARRLSDGSIAVVNSGTQQLRLFDAQGRFLRAMGREGSGPGEFQGMAWVQRIAGDTLLVIDAGLRRASAFTPDGVLQWTTTFEGAGHAWAGDARLPDGSFVLVNETGDVWQRIRTGQARVGLTDRNTAMLVHYAATGAVIDTLGRFPGYEEAIFESDGRPATTYPPWGRFLVHALASDHVYTGSQASPQVRAYRADGELSSIIRWPVGDLAITASDLDRFNEAQFDLVPDDSVARQAIITRTKSLPLPPAKPAYGKLVLDQAGLLWISEAHTPISAPRQWTAIEPGVGVRGHLQVPDRFEVYEIGIDYVLGRWTDGDGVQHVRMHRLNRPASR